MIYLETKSSDVYYNFGFEYYLATEKKLDDIVVLFWRTAPTVMLGKYQNPYEEINLEYVNREGINIVRRHSGGGTIYTDMNGWQFSFIDPHGEDDIQFRKYAAPILDALKKLDLPVEFSGRNDILLHGKKISGNAQFKLNGYTIHHGSLLFDTDFEAMLKATTPSESKLQSKSIQSVRERVTNIREHLSVPMTVEAFKEHMVAALCSDRLLPLTSDEEASVRQLGERYFRQKENIFQKTPQFQIEREKRFPAGLVKVCLNVKKGLIEDLALYGDYFATAAVSELGEWLKGTLYEKRAVEQRIKALLPEGAIADISLSELASLMVEG